MATTAPYSTTPDWQADQSPDQAAARKREALKGKLQGILDRLDTEALDRVSKRREIEKRWIEDLRQYYGHYDEKIASDLEQQERSRLFINKTRVKTNAIAARLSDMLFPTDDKNWGIKPTPVPRLADRAREGSEQARAAAEQANAALDQGSPEQAVEIANQGNQAAGGASEAQQQIDTARKASDSMELEIEDQLRECQYNIQAREIIDDACKLGTGIMKGPVASEHARRSWAEKTIDGVSKHALGQTVDPRPAFYRVDPWGFFPDSDASEPADNESTFERHLMSKKMIRKLARQPGFDKDEIRAVLREEPRHDAPTYIADLRSITGANYDTGMSRYMVWEYRGPLTAEEMRDICACLGQDDMAGDYDDVDPLDEIQVVVWFAQTHLLKFGIHHLDSGDSLYSLFPFERDDSTQFGLGVPFLMRDPQSAHNAAWRMMLDNSGLSSGPQIVVNTKYIEPADGKWALTARKVWKRKSDAPIGAPAFETYDINSHQAELAGIIELSDQAIDDVTNMPLIAQGEQGSHVTQTAQGMGLLMNSVNVVFRRIVKNFDDRMTTPNIRRIYDWNMQFSDKQEIKGDFEIDARGTSVLLVREIQSQNLMLMAMNFSGHPVLGPLLKVVPLLRKLMQSFMLAADEIVMTDDEIKEEAEKQAEQGAPEDPEIIKLQMQEQIAKLENQTKLQIAQLDRDTQMMKLAETMNMDLDKIKAQLQDHREEREHKERKMAAEIAVERNRPEGPVVA